LGEKGELVLELEAGKCAGRATEGERGKEKKVKGRRARSGTQRERERKI
jgi:hypothetical protein